MCLPNSLRVFRSRRLGDARLGGVNPKIGFTANAISYITSSNFGAMSASRGESFFNPSRVFFASGQVISGGPSLFAMKTEEIG